MGIIADRAQKRLAVVASSDTEYLAAAEAGDLEKCQAMVDQAAKSAGYNIGPVYHGTQSRFTAFDNGKVSGRGFYFAKKKDFAESYAKGEDAQTIAAYVSISNPVDEKEFNRIGIDGGLSKSETVDFVKSKGHDGIIGDRVVVPFLPEQIKSADPITYDDSGNIIPLSKRFNSALNDIRAEKQSREFSSDEMADIFQKIPMRDVGGRIGESERRGFAFTAPRWALTAIDPITLQPSDNPVYDTKHPVIVSNGEVWDGRHRMAAVPDGYSIMAYLGIDTKIKASRHTMNLQEKYKALKAAGRISATGRAEEILAEDDWVRVKRMAVPEIDADSYIFTECKRETAVCIVRDADGRYLMRNEATLQSNFTPAPKVMTETLEEGETPEQAVTRGLLEEFNGAPIEPLIYLGSINGTFQELHSYHIYLADGDFLMAGEGDTFDGDGSRGEDRSNNVFITEDEFAQVKDFISWIAYGMMKQRDDTNILGRL